MNCPVCDVEGFSIKKLSKYDIRKCKSCGLEYVDPVPTKEELENFYSNYTDIRAGDPTLKKNALRNIKALSKYGLSKESRLLDFGCGKNLFVETGHSPNWFGYDEYAPFQHKMIKDYRSSGWDFITMWGILEHLPTPKETMQELATYLNAEGKLALTTVTTESSIPYQYKPPEHVTFWTKVAIGKLFASAGLKILEYHAYQMIQNSDIYLACVLRTVPYEIKSKIYHKLPKYILIPTNEIFVVGEK